MHLALRAALCLSLLAGPAAAPPAVAQAPAAVVFENVRIFDGTSDRLSAPSNVLVVGNVIQTISSAPIAAPPGATVTRIAGGGRTLMPGLIDAHTHIMFATVPQMVILTSDIGFVNVAAAKAADDMLMRGFTSIRDLGGPVFGLKRGIDAGLVPGRASGRRARSSRRRGGHGDFRLPNDLPAPPGRLHLQRARRRGGHRRQRRHGAAARARAAGAGRVADQADGRRRRGVELRPARRHAVHRRRAARGGRGGRELGHLRHGARLHAARRAAGDRGRA